MARWVLDNYLFLSNKLSVTTKMNRQCEVIRLLKQSSMEQCTNSTDLFDSLALACRCEQCTSCSAARAEIEGNKKRMSEKSMQ